MLTNLKIVLSVALVLATASAAVGRDDPTDCWEHAVRHSAGQRLLQ
jgi:hypothetical protein